MAALSPLMLRLQFALRETSLITLCFLEMRETPGPSVYFGGVRETTRCMRDGGMFGLLSAHAMISQRVI